MAICGGPTWTLNVMSSSCHGPCGTPLAFRCRYSDLGHPTVNEQLDAGDVGAVVAGEEYRSLAQIVRNGEAAERNGSNGRGFFLIRHEMGKAWRIGVSGAQHVDADVAPLEIDDPGTGERAYRGLRRVVHRAGGEALDRHHRAGEDHRGTLRQQRQRLLHGK